MDQLQHVGRDILGRTVYLSFAHDLTDLNELTPPTSKFVIFIGADTTGAVPEPLFAVATTLLRAGAVYIMCWGPGCEAAEDIFDEAAVAGGDSEQCVVMTTSHPNESVEESLAFATTAAFPDDRYAGEVVSVIVALVGNVNWYNEAHNSLEDLLYS